LLLDELIDHPGPRDALTDPDPHLVRACPIRKPASRDPGAFPGKLAREPSGFQIAISASTP